VINEEDWISDMIEVREISELKVREIEKRKVLEGIVKPPELVFSVPIWAFVLPFRYDFFRVRWRVKAQTGARKVRKRGIWEYVKRGRADNIVRVFTDE